MAPVQIGCNENCIESFLCFLQMCLDLWSGTVSQLQGLDDYKCRLVRRTSLVRRGGYYLHSETKAYVINHYHLHASGWFTLS